jgi:hypothetical protein
MEMNYCVTSYFEDKTEPVLDIQCTRTIDFTKKHINVERVTAKTFLEYKFNNPLQD